MSKAILPGMTSGGTTKLIQETTTNRPVSKISPLGLIISLYGHILSIDSLEPNVELHSLLRLQNVLLLPRFDLGWKAAGGSSV